MKEAKKYMNIITKYQPPSFCQGEQLSVQNFEKGKIRKNECVGELKEFLPWIFAWRELTMFLVKQKTFFLKKVCP